MKGYFALSIACGHDWSLAKELVEYIESLGHEILDRHVIFPTNKQRLEHFSKNSGIQDVNPFTVREQDLKWVRESEFMIVEYTNGSWGGGIEFDQATALRQALGLPPIPILCLLQKGKKGSWIIQGAKFPKLYLREYFDIKEAKEIIKDFFNKI